MRIFLSAAALCLLAAPAWGEVGTVTCDAARAVAMTYSLYLVPNGPTEFPLLTGELAKKGAVCLLPGQALGMDADGFSLTFFLQRSVGADRLLTIGRTTYSGGQMGAVGELYALDAESQIDGAGLEDALAKVLTGDALDGTSVSLPLARRHAYDPEQDGNWQYVPLRVDYWGELSLRIGNPDIGTGEPGIEHLSAPLSAPGELNISKLVQ